MLTQATCKLCGSFDDCQSSADVNYTFYKCIYCGTYKINDLAEHFWNKVSSEEKEILAYLSFENYFFGSKQTSKNYFIIDSDYKKIIENINNSPDIQMERLIKFIYSGKTKLENIHLNSINKLRIGSFDTGHIYRLVEHLVKKNLLKEYNTGFYHLKLEGFNYFQEITRGNLKANHGFMALQFKSSADQFYKNYLKYFVQNLGLELKDMRELNSAGIINVKMEAEIRRSKFLIADITPDENNKLNPNVMWEAGFAEGLAIPVFYICEKNKLSEHPFDIRNHYRVEYDTDNPEEGLSNLKAALINTFPNDVYEPELVNASS